jgi:hypothetical protein
MVIYIFGYGSLVNDESISSTLVGISGFNHTQIESLEQLLNPGVSQKIDESKNLQKNIKFCRISGIRRGWYAQNTDPTIVRGGLSKYPTFLGAYEKKSSTCNGTLFEVNTDELRKFVQREALYKQVRIDLSRITLLYGSAIPADAEIYYFAIPKSNVRMPTKERPIVQSYVDLCLDGFIEMDEKMGNTNYDQTREFIKTTKCWNKHWINDRLIPYRAAIFEDRRSLIDKILSTTIKKRILYQIVG